MVGLSLLWGGGFARGQQGIQNLQAADADRTQRRAQQASEQYTYKQGDFRLLVTPSLALDWNDNIRTSGNQESDTILRPNVNLAATYPLTQVNLLMLNLGLGYDYYFDNTDLNGLRIQSGSALSFDIFIKDFTINLHDRISYTRDAAQNSAVANTADYGTLQNTVGISVAWALRKATVTLGYDHLNVVAIESTFNSQDRATESLSGQVAFELHPQLQAGFEGTASFSRYDQNTLNDNANYSGGVFATWRPGAAIQFRPRLGYTYTEFDNTSALIRTENLSSYYYDLTVGHDITEVFTYGFSLGHEVRAGLQSDVTEVSYFRPSLTWRAFKRASIRVGGFYEQGEQGVGNITGGFEEKYDWYGANVSTGWNLTERLSLALNYRLTIRESRAANQDYTQNQIGLTLTYHPK